MYKNFILYTITLIAGICLGIIVLSYTKVSKNNEYSNSIIAKQNTDINLNDSFYKSEQIKAKSESEQISIIKNTDVSKYIIEKYEQLLDIKNLQQITPNANINYTIEPFKSENNQFWGQLNIVVNEIPASIYFAGEFDDQGINACLQLEQENNYQCMCNYLKTFSDSLIKPDALAAICL